VFAVVRDQDGHANKRVRVLLRQKGGDLETKRRVVSDGENGMSSLMQSVAKLTPRATTAKQLVVIIRNEVPPPLVSRGFCLILQDKNKANLLL
jgi:hypothetical protein